MAGSVLAPLPHVAAKRVVTTLEDKSSGFTAETESVVATEWTDAYEQMLKASLCLFASDILGLEMGPHLLDWGRLVETEQRIAINAARDHGKTAMMSYAYPIWRAWSEPGCETYIFSNTLEQAMEFLDIIIYGRNNLKGMTGIPELERLVPPEGTRDRRTRLKRTDVRFRNGSRIRAIGYGKSIRGSHPKYIVLDDPLNDEDMYSDLVRKKNIEYFKSAITNMLTPDGQLIVVGTPYHVSDLYGFLSTNKLYTFKKYPGIIKGKDGKERPLFPWRWTLKKLRDKREEIGSVSFAREIMCCKPGTIIETSKGPVPIESIAVGDKVLTHTGAWKPVLRTMSHRHEGELVRVKGELFVTPNHPIQTPDGWIEAGKLAVTDLITHPKPKRLTLPPTEINFADTNVPFLYTEGKKRIYARGSATHMPSGSIGKSGAKSIPAVVEIDSDLMWLFGLWLAEGHIANDKTICWSYGEHERGTLVASTVDIIKSKFGLAPQLVAHTGTGSIQVVVGNRILASYLKKTFGCGASGKSVPLWMRDLPPRLLWALALGYIDGDGHVAENSMRVTSVSLRLILDMRFLLARCGLFSTVTKTHNDRMGEIQGRVVRLKACWKLSICGGAVDAFISRKRPRRPFAWGRLHISLKRVPYTGMVYNFEVAEDNSYIADGVTVHNCEAITDDLAIFPSYLFPPLFDKTLVCRPKISVIRAMGLSVFMGVDIARSASVGADYFVIFVIGVDSNGMHYILDIQRHKGLPFNSQQEMIKIVARRYRADLIVIEANAMQQVWSDEVIRTTDLPVKPFVTTAQNKYPLDKGIPGLRILLENGKLVIPRGDEYSIVATDAFITEATQFGFIDGKLQGIGEHDDVVMAWWMSEEAAKLGGFSFSFGEDEEDAKAQEEEMTGGEGSWEEDYLGRDEDFEEGADSAYSDKDDQDAALEELIGKHTNGLSKHANGH